MYVKYAKIYIVLVFLLTTISLSASNIVQGNDSTNKKTKEINQLIDNISFALNDSQFNNDSLSHLLKYALKLTQNEDQSKNKTIVYLHYSFFYWRNQIKDSAFEYLKHAELIAQQHGYINLLSFIYNQRSLFYRDLGYYHLRADELMKARAQASKMNDSSLIFIMNLNLGNLYLNLSDYTSAKYYFNSLLQLEGNDSLYKAISFQSFATIYEAEQSYDSALHYIDSALMFFPIKYESDINTCKLMRVSLLIQNQRKSEALNEFEGINKSVLVKDQRKWWYYQLVKFEVAYNRKDYTYFSKHFITFLDKYEKQSYVDYYLMERIILLASQALYQQKQYLEAMTMMQRYSDYRNKTLVKNNTKYINELKYKYQNVKNQNTINSLMNENLKLHIKNRNKAWMLVTVVLIIIIVFNLIFYKKKNLEQKLTITELEKKNLNKKLNAVNNKIITESLIAKKTNTFLRQLVTDLETIQKDTDDKKKHIVNKNIKKIKRMYQSTKKEKLNVQLESANEEYFKKLLVLNDSLTPTELNMCVFLRINLNTKEVCEITNQSRRTVEGVRYRIRQKLNLEARENLVKFLMNI